MHRLYAVLTGGDGHGRRACPRAMVSAAIGGAVMHPLVADVDDATLRTELLRLTQELLDASE